jgi:peroxiredoxin
MAKTGEKIPSITLKRLGDGGLEDVTTDSIFANRKVVLFSLPGAFTPTCSAKHLPGFVAKADEILAKGVDEIVCISVNDPFVMKSWGEAHGAAGKVTLLPDWDASFSKALDLTQDLGVAGLGVRGRRFSMVVNNGVIESLDIEEGKDVTVSGADHCITHLA